jgi:hypothetical protein
MISKPKREELIMFYVLANPISSREILFSDLSNLSEWNKDKFSKVRKYQYSMAAFDTLFLSDNAKTDKDNFEVRRGLAESFNLGGRLTGKSLIGIKTDTCIAILFNAFKRGVIDSFDKLHLNGVIKDIINIFEFHPFFSQFKRNIISSPDYNLQFKNGLNILSVNNKIEGKSKGDQWCQKHVDRDWAEEASYLTPEVTNKKLMAKSELGMIQRLTGMTDFTDLSPVGKLFNDLDNKNKIINMPSYINPNYSAQDDENAIREFDGRDSVGYLVQILGKIIKGSTCPYDIDRIRQCYKDKLILKTFEVRKENFYNYRDFLILEKLSNAERVGVYMDIGEGSAPTEIIIFQKIKGINRWTHNITVNKITPDELYELVRFIIIKVSANIIGFDNTSGVGKALGSNLAKDYPENLVAVDFNAKTPVDYEKDEKNNYIVDNKGNYIYKEERVDDWAVQRIKHLFYNQLIELPEDYKFDKQIQNIIVIKTGMRIKYSCKGANHLYQAMQVMAISEWQTEFLNIKPVQVRKPGLGVF